MDCVRFAELHMCVCVCVSAQNSSAPAGLTFTKICQEN